MAVRIKPASKASMSIIMDDLMNNVKFDAKQTLPMMDLGSNQYNEGMSLYLQMLGIGNIDAQYNAAVKAFETQLQEQELSAKLDANLASDVAANRMVEAQPGLGTGAAAAASQGRQAALTNVHDEINKEISEVYQTGVASLAEEYQLSLEAVLGKYDPVTNTFAGLTDYQNMADKATEALMKTLALSINNNANTLITGAGSYETVLSEAGYIETNINGKITLTETGQEKIDQIINSVNVNQPNEALGGRTFLSVMAEQMAIADYTVDGVSSWDSLSETKRTEILKEYQSWIYNNQNNLRVSSWELYELVDGDIVLDTEATVPNLEQVKIPKEGVNLESAIAVTELSLDFVESNTESQEYLNQIKVDIESGKIRNGSYIVFSTGKADKADKFYFVYDGYVYKTEYTQENPPPIIDLSSASAYSFGYYTDVGKGTKHKQDAWVQEILNKAKAGKIPEGAYIDFNYGADKGFSQYYMYTNGYFVKVDAVRTGTWDTFKGFVGSAFSLDFSYVEKLIGTSDIIIERDFWGQSEGAKDYLDW